MVNLTGSAMFYLQKMKQTMDLKATENSSYVVHVYSCTTHAQLNKFDCGLMHKITLFWILQEMSFVTVTTSLFLPASLKLILKLLMHKTKI